MNTVMPPQWAEIILLMLLAPHDRQTVSGDLLEEYRERIHPARGRARANRWYVRQVTGFAWRASRTWAVLLSGTFVARTAFDWFVPPADFYARATGSTVASAVIFVAAGFWAAWRSRRAASGALAGVMTSLIAAGMSMLAVASLLVIWHDPQTFAAIEASGGLGEALTLPLLVVVPGALLGALGGLCGGTVRRLASRTR